MSGRTPPVLDRLREPEHTGENRCTPCTVVNVVLAGGASLLVGIVAGGEVAAGVFLAALAVIYLRGYLVPGTPAFTRRYLPEAVLARFGKVPDAGDDETWETLERIENERENAIDPEAFLREVGVVEPVQGGSSAADASGSSTPDAGGGSTAAGSLRLTDAFAADLERTDERHRADPRNVAILAEMFETDADAITFEDREYPAIEVDHRVRKWPSDAALIADVATHEALDEWTDGGAEEWPDVPLEQRRSILESLRRVRESCPVCGGAVGRSEKPMDSCCWSGEVITITCEDCGARLHEFGQLDDVGGPVFREAG